MKTRFLIGVFGAIVISLFSTCFAAYPGQMGVNLGGVSESGGMFVDMAKEHHRYSRLPSGSMTYDSEGWPSCDTRLIMDFRLVAEWLSEIDDPEAYRHDNTGTYLCSFVGQATLAVTGASIQNQVYNSGTNTTTFELVITQRRVYCHIDFTNTQRTGGSGTDTGFVDLKMIKPGYAADTTQIFTDNFMNCLTSVDWSTIRFMNTTATNNQEPTYPATISWSDRKLTTDAAQIPIDGIGKLQGAAWDYVIEVANQSGMDPWINVPVSADTDYVTQLATLFKNNLDASLNVYVENSNEVWNGIFNQCQWNQAQASALGINEHENYARRTVEIAQIFESVFGSGSLNGRVRVMLCCHAPMLKWWVETYMISYINSHYAGSASDYIYGIARQGYFTAPDTTPDNRTIDDLLDDCVADIDAQLDETGQTNEAGRIQWIQKAAQWNLVGGASTYEAGYHTPCCGVLDNLDNKILMHRVVRGGDVLKYNYDEGFLALGANLMMHFTLMSDATRYGFWGLTDDLAYPDRNYKMQACRDLAAEQTIPPGQASNPSPGNGETDVDLNADLSWSAGSGADTHDVYFGTVSPPPFVQNQSQTTYDPGLLATSTTYFWRIDEVNPYGTTTGVEWSFTTGTGQTKDYANADIPVSGTIGGTYADTHASDNTYESITEIESGGKPSNRYSYLEHKWTISVTGGDPVVFNVEAHHTANSEGDNFVFAYSTNDSTYTDMVTVTKTSDDDSLQSYGLPNGTSGTVYIRVKDTDQTSGNRTLDTVYVDEMYISSGGQGNPPGQASNPSPLNGATGVSTSADLSWTAGTGATSHDVYFGTVTSPPFVGNQPGTTYDPGTMAAATTHYWRIDELNAFGTTTGPVWSFTTGAACSPATSHVESIECGTASGSQGKKYGQVTVTVYNNCGNPVSGAEVTGTFTGDFNETLMGTTDGSGVAVITTTTQVRKPAYTFCVDDIVHTLVTYNPGDNVETCDSL